MTDLVNFRPSGDLAVRADPAKRTIELRLHAWDEIGETNEGAELIERGSYAKVDPTQLRLRMDHLDPPVGRGLTIEERDEGPVAVFQVASTARGDEALTLAQDGTYTGASEGFMPAPYDEIRSINGRRVGVRKSIDPREVSLTWRPVYTGSAILAVRTEGHRMDSGTTDQATAAQAPPALPEGDMRAMLDRMERQLTAMHADYEERARRDVDVPGTPAVPTVGNIAGRWAKAALLDLAGDRVPDLELRALADVITADNLGVVPKNVQSELLGVIDPARPFLQATRKVDAGDAGMTQTYPRITQRPLTGKQTAEKAELPSRKTIIDSVDYPVATVGGAGDLSLQIIKRSSPSFLQLWLDLLGESYAINTDDLAVDALLAAGIQAGGAFDVKAPVFGGAFTNALAVGRTLLPDRIFLSTAGLVAFMDAKTPAGGGGTPMYPGLVSIEGVTAGGNGPLPIRLTPVHVPALDDETPDVIIGPSKGFAWAEDGTYTLQADVPSKAGRDVGLAGMIWFMPVYAAAFTSYTLAP